MTEHADVEVRGTQDVIDALKRMRLRAHDLRPAFQAFEKLLFIHNLAQFATEGAYTGSMWKPLSPAYAAWKVKKVGPKPILQFSGRLLASFTSHSPDNISDIELQTARFGSRVEYAAVHQFGRHDHSMPARPPLVVTEVLRQEANRLIGGYIVGDE